MNVPFLENEVIWRKADEFRASSDLRGHDEPPIDMLYVMEVALGFDVIEIPGMSADLRMDAAIVPRAKTVYVDREAIDGWERRDRWIERRLRFSIAHELGHLHLHQEYQDGFQFSDAAHFKRWIREHRQNGRLEDQADEFAGRFLVPPGLLMEEFDALNRRMNAADSTWQEIEGARTHAAKKIAPRFGVNHQVIETRFAREDIWPLQ